MKQRTASSTAATRRGGSAARLAKGKAKRGPTKPPLDVDVQRLVHQLEIHRVELEAQNEELRAARADVDLVLHRYTELFDFAPIGYLVLDVEAKIRDCNLEGARMLGIPRAYVQGQVFPGLFDERQRRAVSTFLDGIHAGAALAARVLEATIHAPHAPGQTPVIHVRLSASALEGSEPRTLVAMNDITGIKSAEEELREESRRKDTFLATLSHELRNPLAPIRTSVALLGRLEPTKEQIARIAAVIDRQVGHLARIVDDLLDVSRIARGKIHLQRERVDLREVLQRTIDDHRDEFEAGRVAVQIRGGHPAPVWVDMDRTRIAQVIGNLLVNALKFTPPGGHVDVEVGVREGRAELSVRDDGVGLAPEIIDHLFEPFVQAPQSLERSRGGLGLGLAMVKGFVELHGGTVTAASAGVGLGSRFVVRLPLCAAPPSADAPSRAPSRPPAPAKRRVLLIEDNIDAAEGMRDLLALRGHDVRVAHDGASGIVLARKCRPEIVLCDIGLPGMDGYDVAREMRADDALRGARLVALSGYARPADRRAAIAAGFDGHLAKPPDLEQLERMLALPSPRQVGTQH